MTCILFAGAGHFGTEQVKKTQCKPYSELASCTVFPSRENAQSWPMQAICF